MCLIFDFNIAISINFKVNQQYNFFENDNNKIGIKNLNSVVKSNCDSKKLNIDLNVQFNSDSSRDTPLNVLSIDAQAAHDIVGIHLY
ncbi:MAG: hypothetical protein WCJ58_07085 [bacterium]